MAKRKFEEPRQDFLTPEIPPRSLLDPEAALRKIQDLDGSFIESALASAYVSYPEIRRAVDIEHYRVDKVRMSKAVAAMAVQRQSGIEAGTRAPPPTTPVVLNGGSNTAASSSGTARKVRRRSGNGYKYNTPTAVAKRLLKRARLNNQPVYCGQCHKAEPDGNTRRTRWQVPNGGDGLVCPECRKEWVRPDGVEEDSDEKDAKDSDEKNEKDEKDEPEEKEERDDDEEEDEEDDEEDI